MLPAQTYKFFTFVLTYALLNRFADAQTTWIVSGDCAIVADEPACVTSQNYPNYYGVDESCTMNFASGEAMVLSVVSFSTETTYDYLTVNGNDYSGSADGLDGVLASGQMTWVSDFSTTATGWKICASEHGSDTGVWTIYAGDCEIDTEEPECITSPNFPENYDDSNFCQMGLAGSSGKYLEVTDFATESCCDYLSVQSDSSWFAGDDPGVLHGWYLTPTSHLYWTSDTSMTYRGWRICARTTSDFGAYKGVTIASTTAGSSWTGDPSSSGTSEETGGTEEKLAEIGAPILVVIFGIVQGYRWFSKRKKKSQQQQNQDFIGEDDVEQAQAPPMGSVVDSAPSPPLAAPVQATDPCEVQSNHSCDAPQEAADRNLGKPTFGGLNLAFDFDSAGQKGLSEEGYGSVGFGGRNDVADECINDVSYPPYWESKISNEPTSKMIPESTSMRLSVLALMDRVAQATSPESGSSSFEVHSVHRLENAHLWGRYFRAREAVAWDLNGLIRHQAKTSEVAPGSISVQMFIGRSRLKREINEFYLFCSTPDDALKGLVETDKGLREYLNIPTTMPKSIPMQEAPQRAVKDASGKQTILLCRACCGSIAQNEANAEGNQENNESNEGNNAVADSIDIEPRMLKQLLAGDFQSWMQERAGSREYVLFNDALIYPEYLVEFSKKSPK
mmetsp:Transcript_41619/g.89349  ORF Transcript_41619/g.89349 Transcript_41619/m.89349 type:complete len:674 (-) Transcript_41619:54-2075(-)